MLDVTARSLSESAEAIAGSPDGSAQGQRADPDPSRVEDALARYLQRREARAASAEVDHDMAVRLRLAVAVEELAVWTRDLAVRVLDLWGWLTGVSFDSRRVADDVTGTTQLR